MVNYKDLKVGNYGRHVTIEIETETCDVCKTEKPCLVVDTSQQEYSSLYICRKCANAQFDEAAALLHSP